MAQEADSNRRSHGVIDLQPSDRIAIVGGGLADRMQHDGWVETHLQLQHPRHRLVFRNLGFTGDELTLRMRSDGFGSPEDWLKRTKANVIFAMFGHNESFAGEKGLPKFQKDLSNFVDVATSQPFDGKSAARLVLFSPIACENLDDRLLPNGREINLRLEQYTAAMQRVAAEQGVGFVDLFHPTLRLYEMTDKPLTINGVHLNETGNQRVAEIIAQAISSSDGAVGTTNIETLRAAVKDKNFHWFHRYRTTDGYSTFGGRKGLGGSEWTPRNAEVLERELEILDVMTDNRDRKIWAMAKGLDLELDDSNTPEFVPVASNKPGPLPDGGYPFLGGEEAIGRMTLAKGMQINLFASENEFGVLRNPVQMAVDPRGRLWVAVWPSYPHRKPKDPMNDKLLILEDTNGDGRADHCKTFADGLHNPTGFEFYNGGVYVAQVPDLWFLKDTDGDDVADVRIRVLGGIDSADTHHSINSFVLDAGGGLYFQEGIFHRTQIETPHGPPVRVKDGGVYRYEPKTQRLDVYSAFSFPNPHGHVFDYWGMDIVHDGTGAKPIFGPAFSGHVDYPQRHPSAPGVYEQRTRPCSGTAILSSAHFPEANRDTLLVGNVIGFQGILQYRLEPDGAGLKGTEIEPIVFSSDVNFRPSDIEIGSDGAIYFSDWQNPLIGHMQHNLRDSNRDHQHGRVYRVTFRDRELLPRVAIADQPIDILLERLKERDNGIRYRAKIELSHRDEDQVVRKVQQWISGLDPHDAMHEHHLLEALWVHQHHHVINERLLRQLLASEDYRVRAAAANVLRSWRAQISDGQACVEDLVHDEHPRVRLMAVLICSDMGTSHAAEIALEAARYPCDRFLQYALKETVATLAPYWKKALAANEPFCADNPDAIDYVLAHAGSAELLKLHPNAAIYTALLKRQGVSEQDLRTALFGLAQLENREPFSLLVDLVSGRDHDVTGNLGQLVKLFARWDLHQLKEHRGAIERFVTTGNSSLIRQGAMAAWARILEHPRRVWEAADSETAMFDLLRSIPLIPEDATRTAYYSYVRTLLDRPTKVPQAAEAPPVQFRYYEQSSISDVRMETMNGWEPVNMGHLDEFTMDIPGRRDHHFAVAQMADLGVRTAGRYTFRLTADDGARLYIDGQELIDNDGRHGPQDRHASIDLSAGPHQLVLTYFNATGPGTLELTWEGDEVPRGPLTKKWLSKSDDVLCRLAIDALAHIPGHESGKIDDLTQLLRERVSTAPTINALRSVPAKKWNRGQANEAIAPIVKFIETAPVSQRTSANMVQTIAFAREIASLLPADQKAKRMADIDVLIVTQISLETVPHRMAYDQEKLVVQAGRPVQLTFHNLDNMPHNFVLTQPGAMAEVGELAEATARTPDAVKRQYVPESDQVLLASKLINLRETDVLNFTAPTEPGIYPYICTYPGHWRRMFGALYVLNDVKAYETDPDKYLANHPLPVLDDLLKYNRPRRNWTFDEFEPALGRLGHASIQQGKKLFQIANCIACHRMNDEGNELGPNLATLDTKQTPADILLSIVEPSHKINEKFHGHSFLLDSGMSVTGLIAKETEHEYQIVVDPLASCEPVIVEKAEVEEKFTSTVSLMPNGLLDRLTEDEILELLTYVVARGKENASVYSSE